jgi:hypothetical protein
MRSRPPTFVDMDMLYANRKQPNIYCFDQKGTWIKEVICLFINRVLVIQLCSWKMFTMKVTGLIIYYGIDIGFNNILKLS